MDDPKAYSFDSVASNSMKSSNPISGCREVDVAKTLDCFDPNPSKNQGGIAIVQPTMVLNDQGGSIMNVTEEVTSTLRAQDHGHPPCVFSAGFDANMGAKAGNIGYEEEKSPTLNAGKIMSVVASAGFSYGQSADARSIGYQDEVSPTLRGGEGGNQKPCVMEVREAIPIENYPNDSRCKFSEDGMVQTLSGHMGTGGNNTPLVMERVIPFDTTQITSPDNWSHPTPDDPCHPLASTAHPPAVAYTQREEVRDMDDTVPTCIGNGQGDIASHISEEVSQTLNCMHDPMAVYVPEIGHALHAKANCQFREDAETYVATAVDCRNGTENADVNGTLQAKEQGQNLNSNNVARTGNTVRRLTPKECERLQSFPDDWTNIGEWVDSQGKKHKDADTPRYKALGNSIALPFWDWLLGRISAQYDRPATLGSLFSGIGGFELCWERHNGKGSAVWASEIEEFAIAVTKKRFGDDE